MALLKESISHKELEKMHQSIWKELENREESFAREFLKRQIDELLSEEKGFNLKPYLSIKALMTATFAGFFFVVTLALMILQLP
ncbi:hypothetical protein ACP26L_15825 [Paenibacillus sp. S-38]|uniref:hypothetical protein n=1 Tax=Paenibacillus sp. S-38 TaxID=3416710 RepID=UPI003CF553E4